MQEENGGQSEEKPKTNGVQNGGMENGRTENGVNGVESGDHDGSEENGEEIEGLYKVRMVWCVGGDDVTGYWVVGCR